MLTPTASDTMFLEKTISPHHSATSKMVGGNYKYVMPVSVVCNQSDRSAFIQNVSTQKYKYKWCDGVAVLIDSL